jgi:hypothetical protein
MTDKRYSNENALTAFYRGEIVGEAILSDLLDYTDDPLERLKLAHLLQLETETKAWLRPHMIAAGLSLAEPAELRETAQALIHRMHAMKWRDKMQFLFDVVPDVVTQYRAHADAARADGRDDQSAICEFMVDHELVVIEFCREELNGAEPAISLAPLRRHVHNPLPTGV